ncbi:MAG TPA: class I SAM-dependent methyltransferase [Patescibacteria group bacterium]|nr:class I SAM-dependent methyltransferase [Patescibacteria group bacterium]
MVESSATVSAQYYPQIFDVSDIARAKEIILTDEGPGAETQTRWDVETPYLMELLQQTLNLSSHSVVLDYGCGIGRMAKAMIDACGCSVIGVDISPNMRALAGDYVGSDRFFAVSPGQFDMMVAAGLRVSAVISIWVLQHSFAPADDIERIRRSLASDGKGFILNMSKRAIPAVMSTEESDAKFAWVSDATDVAELLISAFDIVSQGIPDASRTPNMADAGAYWMSFRQFSGKS